MRDKRERWGLGWPGEHVLCPNGQASSCSSQYVALQGFWLRANVLIFPKEVGKQTFIFKSI